VAKYEDIARAALAESTLPKFVGELTEEIARDDAEGVYDVVFASAQDGYHGWSWVVSIAAIDGAEPTVMELGLVPGEESLLAPDWTPWSERLADWKAQQAVTSEAGEVIEGDEVDALDDSDDDDDDDDDDDESDEDSDDDDTDDEDDDDDDDSDEDGPRLTHSGDIDGVDIDDLDDTADSAG
jgi:hypothetical protein